MKTTCLLALFSLSMLHYTPLSAQTLDSVKTDTVPKARENWYWASGGIGIGYIPEFRAYLPVGIGATFGDFTVFGNYVWLERNFAAESWTTALAGYTLWQLQSTKITASVGIARRGWVSFANARPPLSDSQIGFAWELQVMHSWKIIGIKGGLHGHINPIGTNIGLNLSLTLGWMP